MLRHFWFNISYTWFSLFGLFCLQIISKFRDDELTHHDIGLDHEAEQVDMSESHTLDQLAANPLQLGDNGPKK